LGTALKCFSAASIFGLVLAAHPAGSTASTVEATPASSDVPRPAECLIEPRKFQPPATPVVYATPNVLPVAGSVPLGEPASLGEAEAVTATVREALACRNAGDIRRAYALLTDRMIYVLLGGEAGPAPELLYLLENRGERVERDQRLELVSVTGVAALPDGRLRAQVVTRNAATEFTDLLLFAETDGRWLIDDSIVITREPAS
jgi:hypothetical protein